MKKIFVFMIAALVVLPTLAQSVKPIQDSVLVGHHFAANPVVIYEFNGKFVVDFPGEDREDEIYAWMRPDGAFVRIEINGKDVVSVGDDPVYTLPRPTEGDLSRAWLSVTGYDKYGNRVCGGYVSSYYPEPGSVLKVTLYVDYESVVLKVEIPSGISKDETYMTINASSGGYHYDPELGGYDAYYNPTLSDQTYQIWYIGRIIASGSIDSLTQNLSPDDPQGMSLKMNLPAGVEIADLSDEERGHLPYQYVKTTLDGQTTLVTGELENTKVFSVIRNPDVNHSTGVTIDRLIQARITVFAVGPDGGVVVVDSLIMSQRWGMIRFNLYSADYKTLFFAITEVQFENEIFDQTFDVTIGGGKG